MKFEFGRIFKQLLSEMPIHSARPDTWQKINDRLDDDIPISKMREALLQNEHEPKPELWETINKELDKRDNRNYFFNFISLKIFLPLLVIGSSIYLYIVNQNSSKSLASENINRNKNTIDITRLKHFDSIKQMVRSAKTVHNNTTFENKNNKKQYLIASNSTLKNTNNHYKHIQHFNKFDSSTSHTPPPQTLEEWLRHKDSSENVMQENDTGKMNFNIIEKESYSISGIIKWDMAQKGFVSLSVYNEDGKLIKNIFDKKKYETGEQSFDFKIVDCHIEKNKKYFLKLKLKNVIIKEVECKSIAE